MASEAASSSRHCQGLQRSVASRICYAAMNTKQPLFCAFKIPVYCEPLVPRLSCQQLYETGAIFSSTTSATLRRILHDG
jgi:hypothetical protein